MHKTFFIGHGFNVETSNLQPAVPQNVANAGYEWIIASRVIVQHQNLSTRSFFMAKGQNTCQRELGTLSRARSLKCLPSPSDRRSGFPSAGCALFSGSAGFITSVHYGFERDVRSATFPPIKARVQRAISIQSVFADDVSVTYRKYRP